MKLVKIPIGIETDYFTPQSRKRVTPEGVKFEPSDFVIVSISSLLPIKGIENMIAAVNKINSKCIKLCIIGNDMGQYPATLKAKASTNDNIYFFGKKNDVRPYHAIADLFVIATLNLGEGLPIAPIEAMASGRIVVGSNVSGVKDVLKNFSNCIFETEDSESLKNKILEIQNLSENDRVQLQKDMRIEVEKHFSKTDFIKNHEELYTEISK